MKKLSSYIILTALLASLHAEAQQELCICHGDSCDVFEVRHAGTVNFADGYFFVGHQPYSVQRIDSIVFARPRLDATELGWWGNLDEGPSRCEVRFYDAELHISYGVAYGFTVHDGLCETATCTLTFSSVEQKDSYLHAYVMNQATDASGDPYIYVKETLTGPRKFELWVMSGPPLPADAHLDEAGTVNPSYPDDNHLLMYSLTHLLQGRTMAEVCLIVEGWLYNPLVPIENPDYEPNK